MLRKLAWKYPTNTKKSFLSVFQITLSSIILYHIDSTKTKCRGALWAPRQEMVSELVLEHTHAGICVKSIELASTANTLFAIEPVKIGGNRHSFIYVKHRTNTIACGTTTTHENLSFVVCCKSLFQERNYFFLIEAEIRHPPNRRLLIENCGRPSGPIEAIFC